MFTKPKKIFTDKLCLQNKTNVYKKRLQTRYVYKTKQNKKCTDKLCLQKKKNYKHVMLTKQKFTDRLWLQNQTTVYKHVIFTKQNNTKQKVYKHVMFIKQKVYIQAMFTKQNKVYRQVMLTKQNNKVYSKLCLQIQNKTESLQTRYAIALSSFSYFTKTVC